jgi:hypothetical protein
MNHSTLGTGTPDDPWKLKTPSQTSEYLAWRDENENPQRLVVQVGTTVTPGTVEAWARDQSNPVGGYYGLRKGYRGRFANYVPPVLELLGLVELEHGARNNRVRAIGK